MFNDKQELIANLIAALKSGTLITPKHSVSQLSNPTPGYKTVVVPDQHDLEHFFQSGNFDATLYQNNDPKHNGDYVVIAPRDSSFVAASGVPPRSQTPSHPCDVFVAVSGSKNGLHLFGEQKQSVNTSVSNAKITFVKYLS